MTHVHTWEHTTAEILAIIYIQITESHTILLHMFAQCVNFYCEKNHITVIHFNIKFLLFMDMLY